MPNHLHVVGDLPRDAKERVGAILSGFSRRFHPGQCVWERTSMVRIPDAQQLARQVRYIALNECRAGVSRDPLEAAWSTHRDVIGAAHRPWVDANALRSALGWRSANFRSAWHRYVVGDPSVTSEALALPIAHAQVDVARIPLASIARAALAACRAAPEDLQGRTLPRRLFVHLAREQAWPTADLAAVIGADASSVRRLAARPINTEAGAMCLDPRLHRRFPWPQHHPAPNARDASIPWHTLQHPL